MPLPQRHPSFLSPNTGGSDRHRGPVRTTVRGFNCHAGRVKVSLILDASTAPRAWPEPGTCQPVPSRMIENGKTAEQIAREMVDRFGADAAPVLRKLAAQASAVGDHHGAAAWRDIAVIVEGALRDPCRLLGSAAAH